MSFTLIPVLDNAHIGRFWDKVNKIENSCWEWTGGKRRKYGRASIYRKSFSAHRVSYFLNKGVDPKDEIIMHKCDNPICVNPEHLSLGSNKDNTNDMMSKSRGSKQFQSGESHILSKLTNKDIIDIRKKSGRLPQKEIAGIYNVDQALISRIVNRKLWKTV